MHSVYFMVMFVIVAFLSSCKGSDKAPEPVQDSSSDCVFKENQDSLPKDCPGLSPPATKSDLGLQSVQAKDENHNDLTDILSQRDQVVTDLNLSGSELLIKISALDIDQLQEYQSAQADDPSAEEQLNYLTDIKECGFSFSGNLCIDTPVTEPLLISKLITINAKPFLYSVNHYKNSSNLVALFFELDTNKETFTGKALVYRIKDPRRIHEVKTTLVEGLPLALVSFHALSADLALQEAHELDDYRARFHRALYFLRQKYEIYKDKLPTLPEVNELLAATQSQLQNIIQLDQADLFYLYSQIVRLAAGENEFKEFLRQFEKGKTKISDEAAIQLLLKGVTENRLNRLKQLLETTKNSLRGSPGRAFIVAKQIACEDSDVVTLLFPFLRHPDPLVTGEIFAILDSAGVEPRLNAKMHLPTAKNQLDHAGNNPMALTRSIHLIKKIGGFEAQKILIERMSHNQKSIREAILTGLLSEKLTDDVVEQIKPHILSPFAESRYQALSMLFQISSMASNLALVENLDTRVAIDREMMINYLSTSDQFDLRHVEALNKQLEVSLQFPELYRPILNMLLKIPEPIALNRVFAKMLSEQDAHLRQDVFAAVDRHALGEENISILDTLSLSSIPENRPKGKQYLLKINLPESTRVLLKNFTRITKSIEDQLEIFAEIDQRPIVGKTVLELRFWLKPDQPLLMQQKGFDYIKRSEGDEALKLLVVLMDSGSLKVRTMAVEEINTREVSHAMVEELFYIINGGKELKPKTKLEAADLSGTTDFEESFQTAMSALEKFKDPLINEKLVNAFAISWKTKHRPYFASCIQRWLDDPAFALPQGTLLERLLLIVSNHWATKKIINPDIRLDTAKILAGLLPNQAVSEAFASIMANDSEDPNLKQTISSLTP